MDRAWCVLRSSRPVLGPSPDLHPRLGHPHTARCVPTWQGACTAQIGPWGQQIHPTLANHPQEGLLVRQSALQLIQRDQPKHQAVAVPP